MFISYCSFTKYCQWGLNPLNYFKLNDIIQGQSDTKPTFRPKVILALKMPIMPYKTEVYKTRYNKQCIKCFETKNTKHYTLFFFFKKKKKKTSIQIRLIHYYQYI